MVTKLKDSKTYELFGSDHDAIKAMYPDINTMITTEINLPIIAGERDEGDDSTRIIICVVNAKGVSTGYKIVDTLRLDREFDIDKMITDFSGREVPDATNAIGLMGTAACTAVGLVKEIYRGSDGEVIALQYIQSAISVAFNDPLDVMIILTENEETDTVDLKHIWPIKTRD